MIKFYKNRQTNEVIIDETDLSDTLYELIKPNSTDASKEKHIPVVDVKGQIVEVQVGMTPHPMTEAHLITIIALETSNGNYYEKLSHTDDNRVEFKISEGEKPIAAYAYCNMHGLWSTMI